MGTARSDQVQLLSPRTEFSGVDTIEPGLMSAGLMSEATQTRWFNQCEVIGDFDWKKEKPGVIVPDIRQIKEKTWHDNKNRRVTHDGYLIDPSGNVINNLTNQTVFKNVDDQGGYLPAPFCVECFNFNPFDLYGALANYTDKRDLKTFSRVKSTKGVLIDT